MPELPEVEYTARQLRATLVGATIFDAQVFWERTISRPALPAFLAEIAGRRMLAVRRRGKLLVLDLSSDLMLTIHRRMTGNLLLLPPGWDIDTSLRERDPAAWNTRGPSFYHTSGAGSGAVDPAHLGYCRACLNLVDGRRLLYTDPRKFGRIAFWPRAREAEAFAGFGIEPLGDEFTGEALARMLAGRAGAIKTVLLNQALIAGIGNIYADEALYYACIHPLRPASSLSPGEVLLLHKAIVTVLTLAIEHGGTSFNEYRDLWGEAGEHYDHVSVYQQAGRPCQRCGTPIERIVVAQRGTYFCPRCQALTAE
jgi:formamidopyrimidine-DNA glycosylase